MRVQLILLSLLTSFVLSAQTQIITGQIIDAETTEGLPYANVGILGTSAGTVSNPDGSFELYLSDDIDAEALIRVSFIGYKDADITVSELHIEEDIVIALQKSDYELATVEVRPRFVNSVTIGNDKTQSDRITNFAIGKHPNQNLGAAIGRKFKTKENVFLDSFEFYVSANNFEETRFRVNIYNLKDGRPHELLNREDIIISLSSKQTGWKKVSLYEYQIRSAGEIAVVIEWIYHSEQGSQLALPLSFPSFGTHFYKYGSQGKWKRFRGMSTAMRLTFNG